MDGVGSIVRIHGQETAGGFVVRQDEPHLENVHQLGANPFVGKVNADTQTANQHRRITAEAFGIRYGGVYLLFAAAGKVVHPDAVIGERKGADNDGRIFIQEIAVCLAQQLLLVEGGVVAEKVIS